MKSATRRQFQTNWHEFQQKLKQTWPVLTDDDLESFDGSINDFIDLIRKRTGRTARQIEETLDELAAHSVTPRMGTRRENRTD